MRPSRESAQRARSRRALEHRITALAPPPRLHRVPTRIGGPRTRDPLLVSGTAAVAVLAGGTRWGSYIGFGGIYFTDVALLMGTVLYFVATRGPRARPFAPERTTPYPVLLLVVVAFAVGRLLAGGDLSFVAVRDAVPYVYAFAGILGWAAMRRATPAARRRTQRVLLAVLAFHAAWFGVVMLYPQVFLVTPVISAVQQLTIFTPRPDADSIFVGVLAAVCLRRMMLVEWRGPKNVLAAVAFVGCWIEVGLSPTRAGLLTCGLVCAFTFFAALPALRGVPKRQILSVAALPLVVAVAAAVVPTTTVGQKLLATFATGSAASSAAEAGEGTARARSDSWDALLRYDTADPVRTAVGVGFGPDFMTDSGALRLLTHSDEGGETKPRSPHNYWLGTLSRGGVVGLGIVVLPIAQFLILLVRRRRRMIEEGDVHLIAMIPLATLIPATLGVILESPFGAVPFWWALGGTFAVLAGRADPSRTERSRRASPRPATSRLAVTR